MQRQKNLSEAIMYNLGYKGKDKTNLLSLRILPRLPPSVFFTFLRGFMLYRYKDINKS